MQSTRAYLSPVRVWPQLDKEVNPRPKGTKAHTNRVNHANYIILYAWYKQYKPYESCKPCWCNSHTHPTVQPTKSFLSPGGGLPQLSVP